MQNIELVIFDCDGVLVNSEEISALYIINALNNAGYNYSLDYFYKNFSGKSYSLIESEISKENKPVPTDLMKNVEKQVNDNLSKINSIDGIEQVLSNLKVPKCVASSSKMSYLKLVLGQNNLIDFFGSNYFSAEIAGKPKPAPDVYQLAAKKMGFDTKYCLAIEDSIVGVQAARSAGIRVIGFTGGGHIIEGHDKELIKNGAEFCFNKMEELPKLLPSLFK